MPNPPWARSRWPETRSKIWKMRACMSVGMPIPHANLGMIASRPHLKHDIAALQRIFGRVVEEIGQNLRHPDRISVEPDIIRGKIDRERMTASKEAR